MQPGRTLIRGFSLMEMSVVLTIMAVVIAGVLPGVTGMNKSRDSEVTLERIRKIEDALLAYRIANNRLPCPASATIAEGVTNFGVEGATPGTCIGGTPAANFVATAGDTNYVTGGVPVATLGIGDEFAFDAWGRRIDYAVDKRYTAANVSVTNNPFYLYPVNTTTGAIRVNDATGAARTTPAGGVYALVSHGQDGHGGWVGTVRFNRAMTNADTLENCDCSSAIAETAKDNVLVQKARTLNPANSLDGFDDIVTYKTRAQIEPTVMGTNPVYWIANGNDIYNYNPTTTSVTIGATATAVATPLPAVTPRFLVYEDANNWTAIGDTTALQSNVHIHSNLDIPTMTVTNSSGTGAAAGSILAQNNSTSGSWNNFAVKGSSLDTSVYGYLGVYNRFGAVGYSGVASGEGIRGTATLLAPYALRAIVDAGNTVATSFALHAANNSTSSTSSYGLYSVIPSTNVSTAAAYGVLGQVTADTPAAYGVFGRASSATSTLAYGVYGELNSASAAATTGAGVRGVSARPGLPGVHGSSTSAGSEGVLGEGAGANGYGVYGSGTGASGVGVYGGGGLYGVQGVSAVAASFGVSGSSTGTGVTRGVYGSVTSATGRGVEGTAPAGGYGVYCAGTAGTTLCGGVTAWTPASDARLKEDVRALSDTDGIDSIMRLRPVRYHWKEKAGNGHDKDNIGFLAQDVEKIFPELVVNAGDKTITLSNGTKEFVKGSKALAYETLVVPLVKSVQQLYTMLTGLIDEVKKLTQRVDTHEAEIKALKAENEALKKRLDAIERRLDAVPAKP